MGKKPLGNPLIATTITFFMGHPLSKWPMFAEGEGGVLRVLSVATPQYNPVPSMHFQPRDRRMCGRAVDRRWFLDSEK